jgi:hypothetical protein
MGRGIIAKWGWKVMEGDRGDLKRCGPHQIKPPGLSFGCWIAFNSIGPSNHEMITKKAFNGLMQLTDKRR